MQSTLYGKALDGRLEEAGYVEIVKDFVDRKPHTMVKLSAAGRRAFDAYRRQMKSLFADLPDGKGGTT
jgi:DNA-binding MarR family transcriptional regulator